MEQLVERSFQHGEASAMPFKSKQLFRNSRPTPIDKEKIRVKKASDNSKSSKRKAYDKLRQTVEPENESGNIYRMVLKKMKDFCSLNILKAYFRLPQEFFLVKFVVRRRLLHAAY